MQLVLDRVEKVDVAQKCKRKMDAQTPYDYEQVVTIVILIIRRITIALY